MRDCSARTASRLIREHGRIGYKRMEDIFEENWDSVPFAASASSLRLGVEELENSFGVRPINRTKGKQRGLGKDAPEFVAKIKEYFKVKRQRLGS